MPRHDVQCEVCGFIEKDHFESPWPDAPLCERCGTGQLIILWSSSTRRLTAIDPKERIVVWEHPQTGEVRYPGRNDAPMPDRYAAAGYQRRELTSLREADAFCSRHKVINQKLHYDQGRDGFGD